MTPRSRMDGVLQQWLRRGRDRLAARLGLIDKQTAGILDLFEEQIYAGEITADGHYVGHSTNPPWKPFLGGELPQGVPPGEFWESRVHPDDWPIYARFNAALLRGEDADAKYRLLGLDGVTRIIQDRARPLRRADGSMLVRGIISDVTRREEAYARLAEASDRFRRLLDVVGEHVYLARALPDGRIEELFQGPGADRLLGGAEPDPEMKNWEAALHPDDRAAYDEFNRALAAGEDVDVEYRLRGADGVTRWVHDRAATRRLADGTVEISGIVADVSERRGMRAELERRARTDELTGVHNRRHFAEIVADALASDPDRCGLLLLDADHFKQVNDVHGHVVGDAVLVDLAKRLRDELGPDDCVARWGGEEFAVLLRGVTSDEELERRAQQLRAAVALYPLLAARAGVRLTISVGAVRSGGDLGTLDALVEAADDRLYAAKRQGRNRVALRADADDGPRSEPEAIAVARALAHVSDRGRGSLEAHAATVAALARRIAAHMSLADPLVLRCELGGWLHDIGKAAIPAHILDKPGPLDAAEWAVMETHPVLGERVVHGVAGLREAAAAVRHHHERYDGTGYPDRLAGSAIPIEARVVAAADAYAAMTADRPYSAARTPEEAIAELRRCCRTQLDPRVVSALLAVLGVPAPAALRVA